MPPEQSPVDVRDDRLLFDTLVGQLGDTAVFQTDAQGIITSWNPSIEAVLGYPEAEFVGRPIHMLFTPEDLVRGESECELAAAVAKGQSADRRWHLRRDGSRFFCDGVVTALRNPDGAVRGFLKLMRDATADFHRAHRSAHFAALVASSADAIVSLTSEAIVTSWNAAAEQMFGYSAAEMIGHSMRRVIPEDRLSEPDLFLSRASEGETVAGIDTVRVTKDGRLLDISVTISPIVTESGETDGFSAILRDITANREAERRLDLAVRAHKLGIFDWNIQTGEVVWNEQQYSILGIDPEKFDNRFDTWTEYPQAEDMLVLRAQLEAAWRERRPEFPLSFRVRHPDGCMHYVEGTANIVYDVNGVPVRMVGVNIDVTERKQAEQLLARQAEELARSNRELQAFAYTASHDLQEPIRGIVSFTQLLARRYSGTLGAEADQTISFILDSANRMSKLVASLLDYSRVGESQLARAPVALDSVVQDVRRTLDFSIRDSEAIITTTPLPVVYADEAQMHQLFQNLLSNALKYRQPGQPPRIHIAASPDGDPNEWRITVEDNGIGFHPDYAERVFGVFKRLHGRQYPGTGIGLAICRRIVERHGGRIWAESAGDGQGAAFHFTLPATTAASEAP